LPGRKKFDALARLTGGTAKTDAQAPRARGAHANYHAPCEKIDKTGKIAPIMMGGTDAMAASKATPNLHFSGIAT
jgi:hypothetical protein